MDALERLVAIQEIRDQIVRYAIFFDDKNWEGFAELWAEDAAFVGPGMSFEGKQAVLDFLTTCLPADYNGKHMNAPPLVEMIDAGPRRARAPTSSGSRWTSRTASSRATTTSSGSSTAAGCSSGAREVVVPFREGEPPMSDTAMAVSSATMRPAPESESE